MTNAQFRKLLESRDGETYIVTTVYLPKVRKVFGNKTKTHRGYTMTNSLQEAREYVKGAYRDKWTRHEVKFFRTGKEAAAFVTRNPAG